MNHAEYQPLTAHLPLSPDSRLPVEVVDGTYAIRAAFVERRNIEHLPAWWNDTCGFYILTSPFGMDGRFHAYVGKATNGFKGRLRSHDQDKAWWNSALLIHRDGILPLTSTQASFLEGAVRDLLDAAPNVIVENKAATGDRTLPQHERQPMEVMAQMALRFLQMRGYGVQVARVEAGLGGMSRFDAAPLPAESLKRPTADRDMLPPRESPPRLPAGLERNRRPTMESSMSASEHGGPSGARPMECQRMWCSRTTS